MQQNIAFGSDRLSATISPLGAELQTLRDGEGRDLLWNGDPAFWTGRAPILFPIVGKLLDGHYRLDGRSWQMDQHGFARRHSFEVVAQDASSVTLRLDADAGTREHYPFDFRLEVTAAIAGATLTLSATVENRGEGPMPASFGFHPALRWPVPDGGSRADTAVRFAKDEPEPIKRLAADGGVSPDPVPTPIQGRVLRLRDEFFTNDAIIMDKPHSRVVRYGVPGERGLEVSFPHMPMLGIWTKPGAGFLCIEPWHGHADPEAFTGEIWDKPGMIRFGPGERRTFEVSVRLFEAGE